VDVEVALNGGDGLLVEVGTHARLRGGGLAVTAGDDAAHVDRGEARAREGGGRGRQTGEQLGVVFEVLNVQLFELLVAQRFHADGHVLHLFTALLRGNHDLFQATSVFLGPASLAAERQHDGCRDRRIGHVATGNVVGHSLGLAGAHGDPQFF